MIKIYPEQLHTHLQNELHICYMLIGNDKFLRQESLDSIKTYAQKKNFSEHFDIAIDNNTDWNIIFNQCQSINLFSNRQTLTLILPETGFSTVIAIQLEKLITLIHNDILLIIISAKLTKEQEKSTWYKAFSAKAILVPCITPENMQFPRWVAARAKANKLDLDEAACKLLCYYYEGNLFALVMLLECFSLIWPDGKLTLPRIKQAVSNETHFTPFQWIDALLAGKSKRALHILRQLAAESNEPVILLRTLQRELLFLLTIQRKINKVPLHTLFNHYRILQNRRMIINAALQRLSPLQIRQAIKLLTKLEINIKQDYNQQLWSDLETLSLLLCNKVLQAELDIFS